MKNKNVIWKYVGLWLTSLILQVPPEYILEKYPKEWLAICDEQNDFATAFEADLKIAAFSGEVRYA